MSQQSKLLLILMAPMQFRRFLCRWAFGSVARETRYYGATQVVDRFDVIVAGKRFTWTNMRPMQVEMGDAIMFEGHFNWNELSWPGVLE